ncbi:MAG: MFS transporter, partial [Stackebrandtia sp.]
MDESRETADVRSRLGAWLPAVAVGMAFADASIVALALPSVYEEFHTTIVGVSWVLTAYALVVAVAAVVVAVAAHRMRPIVAYVAGLALFAVASTVCGLSGDLTWLIVGRCLQGAGAAALLGGALAVLGTTTSRKRGTLLWGLSAGIGLAVGPALGGALTTVFDWRAIFLVQAPIALAAIAAAADPRARAAVDAPARSRVNPLPHLGSAFLFSGLVGALFLSVLLIIEVWRFTPLAGAAVVSALPAAMLLSRPVATRLAAFPAG